MQHHSARVFMKQLGQRTSAPTKQSKNQRAMNLPISIKSNTHSERTDALHSTPRKCTKDQYQESPLLNFHNQEPAPVKKHCQLKQSRVKCSTTEPIRDFFFSFPFGRTLKDCLSNTYNKVFPYQKWFHPLIIQ